MSEEKEQTNFNFMEEFKIFLLIFTAIFGFVYVPSQKLVYFAIFSSILLVAATIYIIDKDLSFTKHLLNVVIRIYNIISLIFMVQYFILGKVETRYFEKLLAPFCNKGKFNVSLILWIFILTLFLLILQYQSDKSKEEAYGR